MQDTADISPMKLSHLSIFHGAPARIIVPTVSMTANDDFNRPNTCLFTPPIVCPGITSNATGVGPSGTTSTKNLFKDYFDLCHIRSQAPLHKEQLVPNVWREGVRDQYKDEIPLLVDPILNEQGIPEDSASGMFADIASSSVAPLLRISLAAKGNMSNDCLSHHLQSATSAIKFLSEALRTTQLNLDKKNKEVQDLQSCLTIKELEIQTIKRQLLITNQVQDAKSSKRHYTKYAGPSLSTTTVDRKKNTQMQKHQDILNMEYRRHYVKNDQVDWKVFVDEIIHQGNQHASLYLQQQLKSMPNEQRKGIFEAVLQRAYPLMISRFGNFLVQRLLEVGTADQTLELITKMQGRVISLSCQQFGCHVLQKALDRCHDEELKGKMVRELFDNIPETITHKHACHIWQKVFEMQWTMSNPLPVMVHVNRALAGQWTHIALNETGSLVIQHIFENCRQEEDGKRVVLGEILDNFVTIAKGQWGNWVIQHILEHASDPTDRERAFQAVLDHTVSLSMDQFASKVVEKALRMGGPIFLGTLMDRVTATPGPQHREALIGLASDQYGNYIVQWLIKHTEPKEKVETCRLIKRHLVSLRGSKYGQRVASLVEKVLQSQEITTYPRQHC